MGWLLGIKTLDTDYFYEKTIVDDIQSGLNGTTIEQSASGREKGMQICYKNLNNKNLKRRMLMLT